MLPKKLKKKGEKKRKKKEKEDLKKSQLASMVGIAAREREPSAAELAAHSAHTDLLQVEKVLQKLAPGILNGNSNRVPDERTRQKIFEQLTELQSFILRRRWIMSGEWQPTWRMIAAQAPSNKNKVSSSSSSSSSSSPSGKVKGANEVGGSTSESGSSASLDVAGDSVAKPSLASSKRRLLQIGVHKDFAATAVAKRTEIAASSDGAVDAQVRRAASDGAYANDDADASAAVDVPTRGTSGTFKSVPVEPTARSLSAGSVFGDAYANDVPHAAAPPPPRTTPTPEANVQARLLNLARVASSLMLVDADDRNAVETAMQDECFAGLDDDDDIIDDDDDDSAIVDGSSDDSDLSDFDDDDDDDNDDDAIDDYEDEEEEEEERTPQSSPAGYDAGGTLRLHCTLCEAGDCDRFERDEFASMDACAYCGCAAADHAASDDDKGDSPDIDVDVLSDDDSAVESCSSASEMFDSDSDTNGSASLIEDASSDCSDVDDDDEDCVDEEQDYVDDDDDDDDEEMRAENERETRGGYCVFDPAAVEQAQEDREAAKLRAKRVAVEQTRRKALGKLGSAGFFDKSKQESSSVTQFRRLSSTTTGDEQQRQHGGHNRLSESDEQWAHGYETASLPDTKLVANVDVDARRLNEPWTDIHSAVRGEEALDEEALDEEALGEGSGSWRRQARRTKAMGQSHAHARALSIERRHQRTLELRQDWDWNERFQAAVAELRKLNSQMSLSRKIDANMRLLQLSQDFIHTAKRYGKIIVSEQFLDEKTIEPDTRFGGHAGGSKYVVQGLLFKYASDVHGLYGSDFAAAKAAGHELSGVIGYFNLGLRDLSVPLMALVDFMGFRLIAMPLLPIDGSTIVYGTGDGGRVVHASSRIFNERMHQAAAKLNLATHVCGMNPAACATLHSAADIEGHIGSDGRLYLLDLARTFPPETPRAGVQAGHLYQLLRPEVVRAFGKPLCSDAFSGFVANDPRLHEFNADIDEATRFLHSHIIPACSKEIVWTLLEAHEESKLHTVSVVELMHRSGVNLRHMGEIAAHIYHREPTTGIFRLLYIEAVARVLKNRIRLMLREKMRQFRQPRTVPYRQMIVDFLNAVFTGTNNNWYWETHLKARLRDSFSFNFPEDELTIVESPSGAEAVVRMRSNAVDTAPAIAASGAGGRDGPYSLDDAPLARAGSPSRSIADAVASLTPGGRNSSSAPMPATAMHDALAAGDEAETKRSASRTRKQQQALLGLCEAEAAEADCHLRAARAHARNRKFAPEALRLDTSEWGSLRSLCMADFAHDNPSGRFLLFSRLEQLTGFRFSDAARKKMAAGDVDDAVPLDILDIEEIGEKVKHMNIVARAQALFYLYRGLTASDRQDAIELVKRAKRHYWDALSADPNNADTLHQYAQALSKWLDLQRAPDQRYFDTRHPSVIQTDRYFLRAIDSNPSDPGFLVSYAMFLAKCGRRERAEDFFLRALEADRSYVKGLYEYGMFLIECDQPDDGEQFLQMSISAQRRELLRNAGAPTPAKQVGPVKQPLPGRAASAPSKIAGTNASLPLRSAMSASSPPTAGGVGTSSAQPTELRPTRSVTLQPSPCVADDPAPPKRRHLLASSFKRRKTSGTGEPGAQQRSRRRLRRSKSSSTRDPSATASSSSSVSASPKRSKSPGRRLAALRIRSSQRVNDK
jgi:tetratricopeptide (TPR) repeat protein